MNDKSPRSVGFSPRANVLSRNAWAQAHTTKCDMDHPGGGGPVPKAACLTLRNTLGIAIRAMAKLLLATLLLPAPRVWAQNFSTNDSELHSTAEAARERSAKFWSGQSLPGNWFTPCPVHWSNRAGPGTGLTSFQIQNGEVYGWQMTLRGDRVTVLRDVIPHEVDHTVRASLCRRPLPRWLDEGCASLFESESSHDQLRQLRLTSRQTLLNPASIDQLRYPESAGDTSRLYAEGFSLVEFLLSRGTPSDLLRVQLADEPPSRSLVTVYRADLPRLFSEWHSWEKKRLSAGTRCDCVNCPWHRRPATPLPSNNSVSQSPHSPIGQRPTLTIWTASWCAPCQQFHRDLTSNTSFRQQLESRFQLVIQDCDTAQQHAAQAGIQSVPVFLTPDRRVEGYLGPEWLLQQLGIQKLMPRDLPPAEPEFPRLISPTVPSPAEQAPPAPAHPKPKSIESPEVTTGASSLWSRVLNMAPVVVTVLTSFGVIGGTAVTGGIGGVALMLLLKVLQRRATRASQGKASHTEGGVAPPAHAPFPRELDEAGELLGLRQSEGRVATLDALRGMFLDDELEKLTADSDPQVASLIHRIRTAVGNRVDEVAPLTTKG